MVIGFRVVPGVDAILGATEDRVLAARPDDLDAAAVVMFQRLEDQDPTCRRKPR